MESTCTIMVVDDIPLMRTMLVKYVQRLVHKILATKTRPEDVRIIEAPNGRVALEKLEQELVSLIFLDLMMPEMDGLTFLDRKRESKEHAEIPVIVCSAMGEEDVVERAHGLGASAYVQKPFKLPVLEAEVRKVAKIFFT